MAQSQPLWWGVCVYSSCWSLNSDWTLVKISQRTVPVVRVHATSCFLTELHPGNTAHLGEVSKLTHFCVSF